MRALSLPEIYLLTGMAIGLCLALGAARGLGPRRLLFCGLAIIALLLLIPLAVRFGPLSLGLPLTAAAIALAGFLCALRLFRRASAAWPRPLALLAGAAIGVYAAAGVAMPWLWPSGRQSDQIIYQQGLIVMALPMLLGAVLGARRRRPRQRP